MSPESRHVGQYMRHDDLGVLLDVIEGHRVDPRFVTLDSTRGVTALIAPLLGGTADGLAEIAVQRGLEEVDLALAEYDAAPTTLTALRAVLRLSSLPALTKEQREAPQGPVVSRLAAVPTDLDRVLAAAAGDHNLDGLLERTLQLHDLPVLREALERRTALGSDISTQRPEIRPQTTPSPRLVLSEEEAVTETLVGNIQDLLHDDEESAPARVERAAALHANFYTLDLWGRGTAHDLQNFSFFAEHIKAAKASELGDRRTGAEGVAGPDTGQRRDGPISGPERSVPPGTESPPPARPPGPEPEGGPAHNH